MSSAFGVAARSQLGSSAHKLQAGLIVHLSRGAKSSCDLAASSDADDIMELENAEAYSHQVGDDMHDRHLPYPFKGHVHISSSDV